MERWHSETEELKLTDFLDIQIARPARIWSDWAIKLPANIIFTTDTSNSYQSVETFSIAYLVKTN